MNTTRDIQSPVTRMDPLHVPAARVAELGEKLQLLVDLPGVAERDLELTLEQNLLTLRGRMTLPPLAGLDPAWSEFQPGSFERQFRLGEELDPATLQASLKDGVLRIEIGKRDLLKRIPVRAG